MKSLNLLLFVLCCASCTQAEKAYPPINTTVEKSDIQLSKERAKALNEDERQKITEWIVQQTENFYPTHLGYWIDKKNIEQNKKKSIGALLNYQYDLYDFNHKKLYPLSFIKKNVEIGKTEEIKAVEDALKYLAHRDSAQLLVPSALAYGILGDGDKIDKDLPLIIKLKLH